MNSLHFIRATARGADGEQPAAGRWRHPAWWRGKLPLCFGGMVNRKTDIVSSWLYKNYIKTLDRCEKRVETQGISFCQKQFPVKPCAWCLGRSSLEAAGAFPWISVGFGGSWWLKTKWELVSPPLNRGSDQSWVQLWGYVNWAVILPWRLAAQHPF